MIIFWIIVVLLLPFLAVVIIGAPFVITLRSQRKIIVDVFDLKKGDIVVDLGAGDGSVVLDLATAGFNAVGYEINVFLWLYGSFRCRNIDNATMKLGNYWSKPLPKDTKGVFIFSASRFMKRLHEKLNNEFPDGVQLVSFAFELPGKKPTKTVKGLHLYKL